VIFPVYKPLTNKNGIQYLFRDDDTIVLRAIDVAKYIVDKLGALDIWKLQKLVYYCQAWSLVWQNRPMFLERIEAWANGPVCPELNKYFHEYYEVSPNSPIWHDSYIYDPEVAWDDHQTIDEVIHEYGNKENYWLRELTHLELPWNEARKGVSPMDSSTNEITHDMMRRYYGSL
jgi:uncharacterized phage-associated protein